MIKSEAKRKSEREINAIKADIAYLQEEMNRDYSKLATFVALQPYVEEMNAQLVTVLKSIHEVMAHPNGIPPQTRLTMLSWISTILEEYGVVTESLDHNGKTEKIEVIQRGDS